MSHVSKRKLHKNEERRIVTAFMDAMFNTNVKRGKARAFAILTPTERVMLAKRLAIIMMLEENHSYYRITQTLNVSVSTVARIDRQRETGIFDPLCRIFNRNLGLLDFLELFLAAGMPAMGPNYERRLNALRTGRSPNRE